MKILSKVNLFIIALFLSSCASKVERTQQAPNKSLFELKDKSGTYKFMRESGPVSKTKNLYAVKQSLIGRTSSGSEETMERSIVMSRAGSIKGKMPILRPEKSEYSVWFDGKEYSTRMEIDNKLRAMKVSINGDQNSGNGDSIHKFPEGTGVYCYFSQVVECALALGFVQKARGSGGGKMNFHVVWEGYPFFQQQYLGLPEEVFSSASLSYDGENEKGFHRLSLSIAGQIIFYHLNKLNELQAMYWPAQGLSVALPGNLE